MIPAWDSVIKPTWNKVPAVWFQLGIKLSNKPGVWFQLGVKLSNQPGVRFFLGTKILMNIKPTKEA